jgi:hypothetical protein
VDDLDFEGEVSRDLSEIRGLCRKTDGSSEKLIHFQAHLFKLSCSASIKFNQHRRYKFEDLEFDLIRGKMAGSTLNSRGEKVFLKMKM